MSNSKIRKDNKNEMATSGNGQNLQFFRVQQDRYQDKKGPWYIWDGGWKVDKSFRTFFISSPAPHNIFTGEPTSCGKLFDVIFIGHLLKLNITFDGGGGVFLLTKGKLHFLLFLALCPLAIFSALSQIYDIIQFFSHLLCVYSSIVQIMLSGTVLLVLGTNKHFYPAAVYRQNS